MDQARKFEHQNTRYQSLGTNASLEGAKGMPRPKNDVGMKGQGDQNQPALQAAARIQHFPGDSDISMICNAFSGLHLQELDRVFQRTHFPNVFMRNELGVPASAESEAQSAQRGGPEEMPKQSF